MKLADQVAQQLVRYFPTLKPHQAEKAAAKYCETMLQAIADSILSFGIKNDQISLPLAELRDAVGRISIGKKKEWITNLIQKAQQDMSLVIVDFKGNVGFNSRVSLNPKYGEQIMDNIMQIEAQMSLNRVKEIEDASNCEVAIDMKCLEGYVVATEHDLKKAKAEGKGNSYLQTLTINLLVARHILSRAQANGGVFKQRLDQHTYGRYYMKGINLQNSGKFVRHAALGSCWHYDIQAASYSLMLGLVEAIDPSVSLPSVREYIKDRKVIRKRLAKEVFGLDERSPAAEVAKAEDKIKQVFNALGFGANMKNDAEIESLTYHKSSTQILGKEREAILLKNKEFKRINTEMKTMRSFLSQNFERAFELVKFDAHETLPSELINDKSSKRLSFLFMHAETLAIETFVTCLMQAEERANANNVLIKGGTVHDLVLHVHDCLYFKEKLDSWLFNEAFGEMSKGRTNIFKYVEFDAEPASIRTTTVESLAYEADCSAHKDRIRIEAHKAQTFVPEQTQVRPAGWTRPTVQITHNPIDSEDYGELTDEQIQAMKDLAATPAPKAMNMGKVMSW